MKIEVKREERVKVLENSDGTKTVIISKNDCKLKELSPGEVFTIGEHAFIVLEQNPYANGTYVISKDFMARNVRFGDNNNYCNSSLRKKIETEILPIIEKEVGAENIIEHEVSLTSVDMQDNCGSLRCKVRPITFNESREYNDLLVNEGLGDWWWTCTPWSTEERGWKYSIAVVSPSGCIYYGNCNLISGVRPFCILNSNIFVSRGE